MKKTIVFIISLIVINFLVKCTTIPLRENISKVPLPGDIKIIQPSVRMCREIAAFSGKWIGQFSGYKSNMSDIPCILIVEEIDEKEVEAKVILAWWEFSKGQYMRFVAKVIPGPKPQIEFKSTRALFDVLFNFEMQEDLSTLQGVRIDYKEKSVNNRTYVILKKYLSS